MAAVATPAPYTRAALDTPNSYGQDFLNHGILSGPGGIYDLASLTGKTAQAAELAFGASSGPLRGICADTANAMTVISLPGSLYQTGKALGSGRVVDALQGAARTSTMAAGSALAYVEDLPTKVSTACHTTLFVGGVVNHGIGAIKAVAGLAKGSAATPTGLTVSRTQATNQAAGVWKSDHEVVQLRKDSANKEKTQLHVKNFFGLVKSVSKLAGAVFFGLALFWSIVIPSVVCLAVSTVGVVTSILTSVYAGRAEVHTANRKMIDRVMVAAKT